MGFLLALILGFCGWIRIYDKMWGEGNVHQTSDGGYITTGAGWEEYEHQGILLLKVDSLGNEQKRRLFNYRPVNDSAPGDMGMCVRQTEDGGYIITGVTCKTDYWGDLLIIKTDANGDSIWSRVYKSGYDDVGYWIEQTDDGGYIITGEYAGARIWLLKLDGIGDTMWSKQYSQGNIGDCVKPTKDGGYILSTSYGIIKTDSKGDILWTYKYVCMTSSVCESPDGGYVFTATTWGNFGSRDIFVVKIDVNGDSVWLKSYGGAADDYGYGVQQTKDGGYIVSAETRSFGPGAANVWLLKTDSEGDTLWTRIPIGGKGFSVQQTTDGGYIVSSGPTLIKTDSLGYVGVEEPLTKPGHTDWQVVSPVGSTVTLRYSNLPQGFHAFVFDASGRKVDEIDAQGESGTISWGQGRNPGVYFIKTNSPNSLTAKVVLLK